MKIRVNCIAPVLGQTGLTEDFLGGPATPELLGKFLATIPLGRMSRPEDIASACVYLASDDAEVHYWRRATGRRRADDLD